MATSTLRGLILVGLVVLGFLGLTKLFPQNSSLGVTPGATSTADGTVSPSPSVSVSPTLSDKPRPKGKVTIQVLNGSTENFLAAQVTETLKNAGYKVKTPANHSPKIPTTIIYYQSDFQPEAQRLQRTHFQGSTLKPAPATLAPDIDLQVILGADQAGLF